MIGRSNERGASAVIVASMLIVLMGFAAIGIDVGAGRNERRQNQSAADVGATAGAIEFASTTPEPDARDQALQLVRDNLSLTYSDAEWEALWAGCTDSDRPTGFNAVTAPAGWSVATVDCISGSTSEIRVRVPDQLTETFFGKVLGIGQFRSSAVAQAGARYSNAAGVRPFGILDGIAAGSTCLTTSPSGLAAPPCDGPDSGNFGTLNSQTWAELSESSIVDCGTAGVPELAQNIAMGVDHLIGVAPSFAGAGGPYGAFPAAATRLDDCTDTSGTAVATDMTPRIGPVNAMRADTGFNLFQATKAGLIAGQAADFPNASPKPLPLLQQSSSGPTRVTIRERVSNTQYSYSLDSTPLRYYIRDVAAFDGSPCDKPTVVDSDTMSACLAWYEMSGATEQLFDNSIARNPRFGWAPQFHFTTWGSGNHWQPIKTYRMIYIDTIWFNCNGKWDPNKNDEPCDGTKGLVWAPGLTGTQSVGNGNAMKELRLDQIAAFLLPVSGVVSDDILASFPGSNVPFEVRLTR